MDVVFLGLCLLFFGLALGLMHGCATLIRRRS